MAGQRGTAQLTATANGSMAAWQCKGVQEAALGWQDVSVVGGRGAAKVIRLVWSGKENWGRQCDRGVGGRAQARGARGPGLR